MDGYIWETLARIEPKLTRETRVVAKSDWYGFPPIAARASLAANDLEAIRQVFVTMDDNDEGRRLLGRMNLDGFVPGGPRATVRGCRARDQQSAGRHAHWVTYQIVQQFKGELTVDSRPGLTRFRVELPATGGGQWT